MTIATQQINTVLRTLHKQFKLAGFNRIKKNTPPQSMKDELTLSLEGKKTQIYQRTANHIVEKLTKK